MASDNAAAALRICRSCRMFVSRGKDHNTIKIVSLFPAVHKNLAVRQHAPHLLAVHLAHLRLRDFRNYARLDADFSPGFHLLLGDNAQGKTNILEAIYLLATL